MSPRCRCFWWILSVDLEMRFYLRTNEIQSEQNCTYILGRELVLRDGRNRELARWLATRSVSKEKVVTSRRVSTTRKFWRHLQLDVNRY